jgi:branched-chain amino acid transport system permease protein
MNYLLHLLIYLDMYVLLALSLNIVMGYCGLMSMAHASFFAIGAYSYALLTLKLGIGFVPALVGAAIIGAVSSLAISLPSWRVKGDYFVMMSLAVQAMVFSLLSNLYSPNAEIGTIANLTNGTFGIAGISRPDIFGVKFDTIGGISVISTIITVIFGFIAWLALRSPWGTLLKSMRDDELALRGLGKNARLAKIEALALSCAIAAVAGVIYCSYVSYIDPSSASLDESILMMAMIIVGGLGNFRGPLLGAAVLLLIPEALRFLHLPDALAANLRLLAYGMLILFMIHARPQGLAGEYRLE